MRVAVQSGRTLFLGLGIVSDNFLMSEYSTCRRVEWEMLRRYWRDLRRWLRVSGKFYFITGKIMGYSRWKFIIKSVWDHRGGLFYI